MARRILIVATLAIALIVLAVWWIGRGDATVTGVGGGSQPEDTARQPLVDPGVVSGRGVADAEDAIGPAGGRADGPGPIVEPEVWWTGVVRDPRGTPIADALVTVVDVPFINARWTSTGVSARTDEGGRFRLDANRLPRSFSVFAEALGFQPELVDLAVDRPADIIVFPASTILGRVIDAASDRPLPDAELGFGLADWSEGAMSLTRTDTEGRFRFPAAPTTGAIGVTVAAPGVAPVDRELGPLAPGENSFELRVGEGWTVRGRVERLDNGAPLPAVAIHVGGRLVEATDNEGVFEVRGLRSEDCLIEALAKGYAPTHRWLNPESLEVGEEIVLPLVEACALEGLVMRFDGSPIEKARVITLIERPDDFADVSARFPGRLHADVGLCSSSNLRSTRTDAEGRFRLEDLSPFVTYGVVMAQEPGTGRTAREPSIAFERPGQVRRLDIRFPDTDTSLVGHVTLDGVPVAAFLRWRATGGHGQAHADADGQYRLAGLPPGRVEVDVMAADVTARTEAIVELVAGIETKRDFELHARVTTISGRARDTDGYPVTGRWVFARGVSGGQARTNADGDFMIRLPGNDPGTYRVSMSHGPVETVVEGVSPGEAGVALVVPVLGRLALEVTRPGTSAPLQDVALAWRDDPEAELIELPSTWITVREDGALEAVLPRGTLDVEVRATHGDDSAVLLKRVEVRVGINAALHVEL